VGDVGLLLKLDWQGRNLMDSQEERGDQAEDRDPGSTSERKAEANEVESGPESLHWTCCSRNSDLSIPPPLHLPCGCSPSLLTQGFSSLFPSHHVLSRPCRAVPSYLTCMTDRMQEREGTLGTDRDSLFLVFPSRPLTNEKQAGTEN
jgi:hypothetical protein